MVTYDEANLLDCARIACARERKRLLPANEAERVPSEFDGKGSVETHRGAK